MMKQLGIRDTQYIGVFLIGLNSGTLGVVNLMVGVPCSYLYEFSRGVFYARGSVLSTHLR